MNYDLFLNFCVFSVEVVQARHRSQSFEERLGMGRKQPQRLEPRGEGLFPSPIGFVLRPFSICLHLAPTGEGQSIDLLSLLPESALKSRRAPSYRTPTVFWPCSDIRPPGWYF